MTFQSLSEQPCIGVSRRYRRKIYCHVLRSHEGLASRPSHGKQLLPWDEVQTVSAGTCRQRRRTVVSVGFLCVFRLGAPYSVDIVDNVLLDRRRITDRETPDRTPRLLPRKGVGPWKEPAQHVGDVVDNLLECHVWVNEVEIEDDAVIMDDGDAMQANGVLTAPSPPG